MFIIYKGQCITLNLMLFTNSGANHLLVYGELNSMAKICSCQPMAGRMLLCSQLCNMHLQSYLMSYTILANLQIVIQYLVWLLLFNFPMCSLKSQFKVYNFLLKVHEMLLTASIVNKTKFEEEKMNNI